MVDPSLHREIFEQLGRLPVDQQRRVLEFVRTLASGEAVGVPGKEILRFAGMFDTADLKEMEKVIQEECERIDLNEW